MYKSKICHLKLLTKFKRKLCSDIGNTSFNNIIDLSVSNFVKKISASGLYKQEKYKKKF